MAVTLTVEQELVVRQDALEAGFSSAEEYLASRLESVHSQDQLYFENREEWDALIEEGIWSAENEPLLTPEEAKEWRDARKREFFAARDA